MAEIEQITRSLEEQWAGDVMRKTQPNPPKKRVSLRKITGKSWRQKIKLGEETYYLSGFDQNEPGELRIGIVKLDAEMDADARVEALAEFGSHLVDLPSEVVRVAVWKDAEPSA
jgi:hypothetical protein